MWHLAMIMVCSLGGDVCTYKLAVATTQTEAECKRLGYLVGGGALEKAYGRFDLGEITVTCERVREVAAATSEAAPGATVR